MDIRAIQFEAVIPEHSITLAHDVLQDALDAWLSYQESTRSSPSEINAQAKASLDEGSVMIQILGGGQRWNLGSFHTGFQPGLFRSLTWTT